MREGTPKGVSGGLILLHLDAVEAAGGGGGWVGDEQGGAGGSLAGSGDNPTSQACSAVVVAVRAWVSLVATLYRSKGSVSMLNRKGGTAFVKGFSRS